MKFSLILGLAICVTIAKADQETLVLVDNLNIRETHSQFFKSLQGKIFMGYAKCRLSIIFNNSTLLYQEWYKAFSTVQNIE